jgi:hypothetical protein
MLGILGLLILAFVSSLYPLAHVAKVPLKRKWPQGAAYRTVWILAICLLLIASTAFQESLVHIDALQQSPLPSWLLALPVIPVMDTLPFVLHADKTLSTYAELLAVLQTIALIVLIKIVGGKKLEPKEWIIVGASSITMAWIWFCARSVLSVDVYAYIGYGIRGLDAYTKQRDALPNGFSSIYQMWENPFIACAYGPGWLVPATLLMHGVTSIAEGVFRFRCAGIASVFVFVIGLVRLRVRDSLIAVTLINPFLWQQFVGDAHNDLWAIALIIFAMSCTSRPVFAVLLGAIAGAMKIPFLIIACIIASAYKTIRTRVFVTITIFSCGILVSGVLGYSGYYHAISSVATMYNDPTLTAFRILGMSSSALAIIWAIIARKFVWTSSFGFQAIGFAIFPWYQAWGLPLAILADDGAYFLAILPILGFLSTAQYLVTQWWYPLLTSIFVISVFRSYRILRDILTAINNGASFFRV